MKKHNADQFELPAVAEVFNLAGQPLRQEAPPAAPAPDPTPDLFPNLNPQPKGNPC